MEIIRDGVAEFVEAKLKALKNEVNCLAQMSVVLTENCLIEQGIQMSLLQQSQKSFVGVNIPN